MTEKSILAALVALALAASAAMAQKGRGPHRYDPSTEVTLKGTVEEVKTVHQDRCPMCPGGTHLIVKTEAETLEVHVAPSWFLADNKFAFAKGDSITVTGSKVKWEEQVAVLAREIKKGDETLSLRDANGIPLWAGPKRR